MIPIVLVSKVEPTFRERPGKDSAGLNSRKAFTTTIKMKSGTRKIQANYSVLVGFLFLVGYGIGAPSPPVLLCSIPTRGFGSACPGGGEAEQLNTRVDFVAL